MHVSGMGFIGAELYLTTIVGPISSRSRIIVISIRFFRRFAFTIFFLTTIFALLVLSSLSLSLVSTPVAEAAVYNVALVSPANAALVDPTPVGVS